MNFYYILLENKVQIFQSSPINVFKSTDKTEAYLWEVRVIQLVLMDLMENYCWYGQENKSNQKTKYTCINMWQQQKQKSICMELFL